MPKLGVYIIYYQHTSEKFKYFSKVVEEYSAYQNIDVSLFVFTKSTENKELTTFCFTYPFITLLDTDLTGRMYPWSFRGHMKENNEKFDYVIIQDDDLLFKESTFKYFCEKQKNLPENYYIGLHVIEKSADNALINIKLEIGVHKFLNVLEFSGKKYVQLMNVHNFYILNKKAIKKCVEHPDFLCNPLQFNDGYILYGFPESSTAQLPYLMGVKVVTPIEEKIEDFMCIEHLPKKYQFIFPLTTVDVLNERYCDYLLS